MAPRAAASPGSDESFTGLSAHVLQFGCECARLSLRMDLLRPAHHVEASENLRVAVAQARSRIAFNSFSQTLQASNTQLFFDAFTVEGEECVSDKPKIECLPVSVDLSMYVYASVQQGREII